MKAKFLFCFLQLILPGAIGQDSEPSVPSHMPSPPARPAGATAGGGGGRRPEGGGAGGGLQSPVANAALPGSVLPNPPPQNAPNGPTPTAEPPPPPVPFGLNHIILILVPQFKTTIPHLPKWVGANTKVSIPITVFFDKLKIHPPPQPQPPPQEHYEPFPYYGPLFPEGHFVQKRSAERLLEQSRGLSSEESTKWNGHRHQQFHNSRKASSLMDQATFRAERVTLLPKLEKLLESFGLGGKSCLLRTICETHDFPLEHHGYGLAGELLTLFFSISRSAFANSHLSEYLEAENAGKTGDCKKYLNGCSSSLFFWEKIAHQNETDIEDEELELLNQLF